MRPGSKVENKTVLYLAEWDVLGSIWVLVPKVNKIGPTGRPFDTHETKAAMTYSVSRVEGAWCSWYIAAVSKACGSSGGASAGWW